MGFQSCPYDNSLFFRQQGYEIIILLIDVNGIILARSSSSSIEKIIAHLSTVFHMKNLRDLHFFLGV